MRIIFSVYADPALVLWDSGIVSTGCHKAPITCGRENLQGIIQLVLTLSLPIIGPITVSRHNRQSEDVVHCEQWFVVLFQFHCYNKAAVMRNLYYAIGGSCSALKMGRKASK